MIVLSGYICSGVPFVAIWMQLEIIIISEVEKDKYHMISLYVESKI